MVRAVDMGPVVSTGQQEQVRSGERWTRRTEKREREAAEPGAELEMEMEKDLDRVQKKSGPGKSRMSRCSEAQAVTGGQSMRGLLRPARARRHAAHKDGVSVISQMTSSWFLL